MIDIDPGPREIEAAIRGNKEVALRRRKPNVHNVVNLIGYIPGWLTEESPVITLWDNLPISKNPSDRRQVYCTSCAAKEEPIDPSGTILGPKVRTATMKPMKFGWSRRQGWIKEFHELYDVWTGQCKDCFTIFVVVSKEGQGETIQEEEQLDRIHYGGGNPQEPTHPQAELPPSQARGPMPGFGISAMDPTGLDDEAMPRRRSRKHPVGKPKREQAPRDDLLTMPAPRAIDARRVKSVEVQDLASLPVSQKTRTRQAGDEGLLHLHGSMPELLHHLPRSLPPMLIEKEELVRLCDSVDSFANEMKAKLITKYVTDGFVGWRDPETLDKLREGMMTHASGGDDQAVDVANFAMMIDYHNSRRRR